MSVPGIGPTISSAMVAAISSGDVFGKGRDFGAWLGLVPKQISTGDRTILGNISKRGNRYLRALFVQAVWFVLVKVSGQSSGSAMGSDHGLRRQRSDCTTMCSPLRWPTSSPASPGRFSTRGAPSR
jgi:transposase